jgi:hypothetical protein
LASTWREIASRFEYFLAPGRGRRSVALEALFANQKREFCAHILDIAGQLEFKVSSRGWAYILENESAITKDELDKAQAIINDCRKDGSLPIDICLDDETRLPHGLEELHNPDCESEAQIWVDTLAEAPKRYTPLSFWDKQQHYVEIAVEKIDLRSLFTPVCAPFHIPITNFKGWSDIAARARMIRRFAYWQKKGKICVLLYCGDFDPKGLHISEMLRENFRQLKSAYFENEGGPIDFDVDALIIERFGLNYDFIEHHRLPWIEGLKTGSGKDLADPDHKCHEEAWVKGYIAEYGERKVEANALVVRPEAGRNLCRDAISFRIVSVAGAPHNGH